MSSSPVYVGWRFSTRVSPAVVECAASSLTPTALDTAKLQGSSLERGWICTISAHKPPINSRRFHFGGLTCMQYVE